MSSRKSIWSGMDRLEGKKEGSSYKHLEKEMKRQGYSKSKALEKAKKEKDVYIPARGGLSSRVKVPKEYADKLEEKRRAKNMRDFMRNR